MGVKEDATATRDTEIDSFIVVSYVAKPLVVLYSCSSYLLKPSVCDIHGNPRADKKLDLGMRACAGYRNLRTLVRSSFRG